MTSKLLVTFLLGTAATLSDRVFAANWFETNTCLQAVKTLTAPVVKAGEECFKQGHCGIDFGKILSEKKGVFFETPSFEKGLPYRFYTNIYRIEDLKEGSFRVIDPKGLAYNTIVGDYNLTQRDGEDRYRWLVVQFNKKSSQYELKISEAISARYNVNEVNLNEPLTADGESFKKLSEIYSDDFMLEFNRIYANPEQGLEFRTGLFVRISTGSLPPHPAWAALINHAAVHESDYPGDGILGPFLINPNGTGSQLTHLQVSATSATDKTPIVFDLQPHLTKIIE